MILLYVNRIHICDPYSHLVEGVKPFSTAGDLKI